MGFDVVFSDIGKVIDDLITNTFVLEKKNYLQTIEKQDERFRYFDYSSLKSTVPVVSTTGFTDLSFSHQINYVSRSLTSNP